MDDINPDQFLAETQPVQDADINSFLAETQPMASAVPQPPHVVKFMDKLNPLIAKAGDLFEKTFPRTTQFANASEAVHQQGIKDVSEAQNFPEKLLRKSSAFINDVFTPPVELGKQMIGSATDIAKLLTPQPVQRVVGDVGDQAAQTAGGLIKGIGNTPIPGGTLSDIPASAVQIFKKQSPRTQKNLEAAFNVASALPIGEGGKDIVKGIEAVAPAAARAAEAVAAPVKAAGQAIVQHPTVVFAKEQANKFLEPGNDALLQQSNEAAMNANLKNREAPTLSKDMIEQAAPEKQKGIGPRIFEDYQMDAPSRSAMSAELKPTSTPVKDLALAERNRLERGDVQPDKLATGEPNPQAGELNPSAFQLFAIKELNPALERLDAMRDQAGKQLEEVINTKGTAPINLSEAKENFDKSVSRILGAKVEDASTQRKYLNKGKKLYAKDITTPAKVTPAENRFLTHPELNQHLIEINTLLSDPNMTARKAQDIKSRLDALVWEKTPAGYVKNNELDAVVKPLRHDINKELANVIDGPQTGKELGPYRSANKEYGKAKSVHDEFYKRMGPETDIKMEGIDEPISRHAASIAKRAVQSNADSNTQAILKKVSDLLPDTDLLNGAKRAEVVMRAAKDLKAVRGIDIPESKAGIIKSIQKGAMKGYEKLAGDPLTHVEKYHAEQQAKRTGKQAVIDAIKGKNPDDLPPEIAGKPEGWKPVPPEITPQGTSEAAGNYKKPVNSIDAPENQWKMPDEPQSPMQNIVDRIAGKTNEQQHNENFKKKAEDDNEAQRIADFTPEEKLIDNAYKIGDNLRKKGYIYDEKEKKYVPSIDQARVDEYWTSDGRDRRNDPQSFEKGAELFQDAKSKSVSRETLPAQEADKPTGGGLDKKALRTVTPEKRRSAASNLKYVDDPQKNRPLYLRNMRSDVRARIKSLGTGKNDWELISGGIVRDEDGNFVRLSPEASSELTKYAHKLFGEEAYREELQRVFGLTPDEMYEDGEAIRSLIAEAPNSDAAVKGEWRILDKNKTPDITQEESDEMERYDREQAKTREPESDEEEPIPEPAEVADLPKPKSGISKVVDKIKGNEKGSVVQAVKNAVSPEVKQIAKQAEKQYGIEFKGIQKGAKDEDLMLFDDKKTKSSFIAKTAQDIPKKLNEMRKNFGEKGAALSHDDKKKKKQDLINRIKGSK